MLKMLNMYKYVYIIRPSVPSVYPVYPIVHPYIHLRGCFPCRYVVYHIPIIYPIIDPHSWVWHIAYHKITPTLLPCSKPLFHTGTWWEWRSDQLVHRNFMDSFMFQCMYVCLYVCMYVYIYIYIYIHNIPNGISQWDTILYCVLRYCSIYFPI